MSNDKLKVCTKCNIEKPLDRFNSDVSKKDGLYPSCKDCYAEYYALNRGKKLAWKKQYREKNKAKIEKYRIEYYLSNINKQRQYAVEWAKKNPINRRVNQSLRRAKQRKSFGQYSKQDVTSILSIQKNKCACCHLDVSNKFHVDHIIPLALGGSNDRLNIQILCPSCNQQKRSKHPIDFMQERGFLL